MSGVDMTAAAAPATDAPATDAPASSATGATLDSMGVLSMTEQTQQFVIKVFAITICAVVAVITGVLCYRVAIDGDAPLTSDITHQLVSVLPWLVGALVAAIVGQTGAKALLAKVLP